MKSSPIDISYVRQRFSRPDKLIAADFINREIAARMRQRLELIRLDPACIVDAGCGYGADWVAFKNYFPSTHIVGVDASEALLRQALQSRSSEMRPFLKSILAWAQPTWKASRHKKSMASLVNADFAQFPLADRSADLVWSNLALHWHPLPDQVFNEWQRVLRTDGLLMFSCFGPDTFKELREAFRLEKAPENANLSPVPPSHVSHVLPFVDMHDYGDMLVKAGFATPVMDMEIITLTYETVAQLLAEVRAVGGNPLETRRKGLMGKAEWRRLCDRLEQMRNADGRIPLTLEIIYGHAFKPVAKKTKAGESIIEFKHWRK